jgi:UDP-N-acetylmuramate dehydrogenase
MTLDIRENIALAPYTTFGIGAEARYFIDVWSEDDMREALAWAKEKGMRHIILSGGSNVLAPGENVDAVVIHVVGDWHENTNGLVNVWTGTTLLDLIRVTGMDGWGGWEKLAGIPGTIGGAVRGNAGAFGSEIKDFVVTVRALNVQTGEIREFSNAECGFSYRQSFFKRSPEWLITRVWLQLTAIDPKESERLIDETIAERERRHLQNVKAAGSFFMNPVAPKEIVELFEKEKGVKSREGRVPAGWLIEKAGMKGAQVGGAIASLQHPNYIVNMGNATAHDVRNLAQMIKLAVLEKCGVELHEEAALL